MTQQLSKALSLSTTKKTGEVLLRLNHLAYFQQFAATELTFSFYPYARDVDADSFKFLPYQEYLEDVQRGQRTTYQPANRIGDKVFGLWLSGMALFLVGLLNPSKLYSLEAVLSILGAYALGKELWSDLDDFLVKATKAWQLHWNEVDYYYQREDFGTVQRFAQFARVKRYGNETTLASKLDYVTHSNSQTIDLFFKKSDLLHLNQKSARVLSCEFELNTSVGKTTRRAQVQGSWVAKIAVHRRFGFIHQVSEYYQALDNTALGTLDHQNRWLKGKLRLRQYLQLGRLIWIYAADKYLTEKIIEKV